MNAIFNPKIGKIYDFFHVIARSKNVDEILDSYKDNDIAYFNEISNAYKYIWEGLDKNTPGLGPLIAENDKKSCFLLSKLSKLWVWKTTDVFLESFDRHIHGDLRYDLLSFYDTEGHSREYYRDMTEDSARLHAYINNLDVSGQVKFEMTGIASGSEIYTPSLQTLFKTIADRIDRVYEKFADIIEKNGTVLAQQLNSSVDALLRLLPEFINFNELSDVRITLSFLDPELRCCLKVEPYLDVYFGSEINYFRTNEKGSLEKYALFFKALSDESRVKIIKLLRERERYMGEISKELKIPMTTLTYHLQTLKKAGIISLREEGKKTFCIFNSKAYEKMLYDLGSLKGE